VLGVAICAVATMILCAVRGWPGWIAPAVVLGCWAHILGDAATEHGVPLAWPHPARFRFATINTGSWVENLVVLPLLLAGTAAVAWTGGLW
jgi:membrane-bound metal-dependent hydrolase YbcI (DUF457 family)